MTSVNKSIKRALMTAKSVAANVSPKFEKDGFASGGKIDARLKKHNMSIETGNGGGQKHVLLDHDLPERGNPNYDLSRDPNGPRHIASSSNPSEIRGLAHRHINSIENAVKAAKTHFATGGDVEGFKPHNLRAGVNETSNPKRAIISATGPGGVKGMVVPRHMWEGTSHVQGMKDVNEARAKVYGPENRDPLTVGKIGEIHKKTLDDHFKRPLGHQIAAEKSALDKLRAAKHIAKNADTLDESEKLDTVHHERDEKGRSYVAYGSKGTAGHALYTSGTGANQKFHALNTCPGQTTGCGGGVDHHGVVDTKRGTCFAPNAESQYPGAAVRRASHAQAKHDPAMTTDWILAHTGSLRAAAKNADRQNKITLFRPNIVDESDRSTRHVIKHLNRQRAAEGKPGIIANSYGKTSELHDPKNGYHVTYSNAGPKTKRGHSIAENVSRDKSRVRSTITAADAAGNDFKNDEGEITPPKHSYMVADVQRYSDLDKKMQKAFTHAKYWSAGRDAKTLSEAEKGEGHEGHYDENGKPTTAAKSHFGHTTLNGKRYDYQKQHILHPRMVQVGQNEDGSPHIIPTDSRFKDDEFLPKDRFMSKNGKQAGAIVLTTPTTSTNTAARQSSFTHHVNEGHIEHAHKHHGEYEIDSPHEQEASAGKEYVAPRATKDYATGGAVGGADDVNMAFPEQTLGAQIHNAHRAEVTPTEHSHGHKATGGAVVDKGLSVTRQAMRSGGK